jgi:hypothetical protein
MRWAFFFGAIKLPAFLVLSVRNLVTGMETSAGVNARRTAGLEAGATTPSITSPRDLGTRDESSWCK